MIAGRHTKMLIGVQSVSAAETISDAFDANHESLAILVLATAEVVGEVSKVYQAMRQAIDGGVGIDLLAAARAFDKLPAWQREKIRELAEARAEASIGELSDLSSIDDLG